MRAFVTGGAGFVGSTLVDRLLAEGHRVDVVDDLSSGSLANLSAARRDPDHDFHFQRLDIAGEDLPGVLERSRPDVVYHLAAGPGGPASVDDPVADAVTGIIGSLRVLEGARRAGARKVVFATSATALYADEPRSLPARESTTLHPADPHGVAKAAVAQYLALYRELHALEYTALALATVYGPRQVASPHAGVIAALADSLVRGEAGVIHGDGSQTRDFVYVDDAVDALARAADRGSGLLLNVGTGVETSITEVHRLVAKAAGTDLEPEHVAPLQEGPLRRAVDPNRAKLHLGWEPWTSLAEGIALVVGSLRL